MRKIIFLFVALLVTVTVFAQRNSLSDVVYLKNGSILKGIIIEQVPNELIKLQTTDGNIFVYQTSEIEKITKENLHDFQNLLDKGENYKITENGFSTKYWNGSQSITKAEFLSALNSNLNAYSTYNYGKSLKTIGAFFYIPSSIVIGWQLGDLMSGNNDEISPAMIIGGVAFLGGLSLVLIGNSHINKSLSLLNNASSDVALDIDISFSEFSLTLKF